MIYAEWQRASCPCSCDVEHCVRQCFLAENGIYILASPFSNDAYPLWASTPQLLRSLINSARQSATAGVLKNRRLGFTIIFPMRSLSRSVVCCRRMFFAYCHKSYECWGLWLNLIASLTHTVECMSERSLYGCVCVCVCVFANVSVYTYYFPFPQHWSA